MAKLNAAGSALVYSTYLGGSGSDIGGEIGYGIAVDSSGNAYVTGQTFSANFPIMPTSNPLQTYGGNGDAFVAKLNFNSSTQTLMLVYSTFLGGSNFESGSSIAIDSSGDAYVTGGTVSDNFPTTENPYQATNNTPGKGTAFVTKLHWTGSALGLVYSTYLGGSTGESGNAIAIDSGGDAYVTGQTYSTDFPTVDPIQATCAACTNASNAFVTKFNSTGSALVYSTFLGGNSAAKLGLGDFGYGIAVDSTGNAYVTGLAWSTNFPTANPLQPTASGGGDAFVVKISPISLSPSSLAFAPQVLNTPSAPQTVTLTYNGATNLIFSGISITGTNLSDFEIAPATTCSTSGPVEANGGQCTVSVTFSPAATGPLIDLCINNAIQCSSGGTVDASPEGQCRFA